jgi:hypothetical protein
MEYALTVGSGCPRGWSPTAAAEAVDVEHDGLE